MKLGYITGALFAALALTGCSERDAGPERSERSGLKIYTSIAPLNYVCERLLGDEDEVIAICPIGEDEPEYVPLPETLVEMIDSDLIVINGATFENWLNAVSIPETLIFDTAEVYREEWVEYDDVVHSHGDKEDHSHTGFNGHTWTAPRYFHKQSTAVYERLRSMLGEERVSERNLAEKFDALSRELLELDRHGAEVFAPMKGKTIAASHPTYDYLGMSYGFNVFNIDLPPDEEEISESIQEELDELKANKEAHGTSIIFWEEEPNELIQEALAELGVWSLVFHPLAGMDDPDYITGMMANFERAETAISNAGE